MYNRNQGNLKLVSNIVFAFLKIALRSCTDFVQSKMYRYCAYIYRFWYQHQHDLKRWSPNLQLLLVKKAVSINRAYSLNSALCVFSVDLGTRMLWGIISLLHIPESCATYGYTTWSVPRIGFEKPFSK